MEKIFVQAILRGSFRLMSQPLLSLIFSQVQQSFTYTKSYFTVVNIILFTLQLGCARKSQNGFERSFINNKLTVVNQFKFGKETRFYFSGFTDQFLYLKDLKRPSVISKIDTALTEIHEIPLSLSKKDSSNYYALTMNGNHYGFGKSGNLIIRSAKTDHVKIFPGQDTNLGQTFAVSEFSIIGTSSLLLRSAPARQLVKINYSKKSIDTAFTLPKLVDGYFCTDGLLKFDQEFSKIYYMYVYRGSFLCLDTNLKTIYEAKTIDTISHATIRLDKIKNIAKDGKSQYLTQTAPPQFVNRNIAVYNNSVYILSALQADNETDRLFKHNQTIDVYNGSDGSYLFSFHVPRYNGNKLTTFLVKDKHLYGIFDDLLVKFKMSF